MLSTVDIAGIVGELRYKPGWRLSVYDTGQQGQWFAIDVTVEDSYSPGRTVDLRIKSPIPPMADRDALLKWVAWRLATVEVHECHEWLRHVDGRPVFDPHAEGADEPA